jgi:hypothetical protein
MHVAISQRFARDEKGGPEAAFMIQERVAQCD